MDPIRAYIGNDLLHVPPEQYPLIAARWGLDLPLWERSAQTAMPDAFHRLGKASARREPPLRSRSSNCRAMRCAVF